MKLAATELRRAVEFMQQGNWDAAHKIVQEDEESSLSCWAHGIVHLMEGDVSNARYWYREAKRPFPEPPSIENEIKDLERAIN
jgi:Tfp pilus assembly protein PilF